MYKNQYGYFDKRTHKWTEQAIKCYKIGCNCSFCEIPKLITYPCRMKGEVLELVRKLGAPKIERNDIL
jgi:hypothetical protein